MPHTHRTRRSSPSSTRRSAPLIALAGLVLLLGGACSSDGPRPGAEDPAEVLDAHIAYARDFDLAADCELRSPERIEEMARADGREPEGYCEFATGEPMRLADESVRARAREIYADVTVEELDRSEDLVRHLLVSADGTHRETVEIVREDGRWFLGSVEVEVDEDLVEDPPPESTP